MGTTPRQYDPNEYTFGDFAKTMNNNAAIDMAQANGTNAPVSTTPSGNMVAATVAPGETTPSGNMVAATVAQVPNAVGVEGTGAENNNLQNALAGLKNSFYNGNYQKILSDPALTQSNNHRNLIERNPKIVNPETRGEATSEMRRDWIESDTIKNLRGIPQKLSNILSSADNGEVVNYSGTGTNGTGTDGTGTDGTGSEGTGTEGTGTDGTGTEGTESVTPGPLDWITDEEASWMDDGTTDTGGTVTNTGTEGTEGTTVGTEGTVTGAVTGSGEIEYDKEETLGYAEWESTYSVNAETEYRNAQAQLDYEFQTWMSTYGARAEELYQMGLSNSGVSDIYGLGAYTAYIQASMDLKRSKIELDKQNKQEYQKYVDNIASRNKAAQEAIKSKIGSAFASYADTYTPADEAKVRAALTAQGYSESEVSQVINYLNQYYNSTPDEDKPDVIESNEKVSEGYNMYLANYKPENSQNIYNELVNVHGYTKQEAMAVIKKLQASYEANAPARFEADVNTAAQWMQENYSYGMSDDELIALLGSEYSEDVVKAAMEKFAPYKEVVDRLAGDQEALDAFDAMLALVNSGKTDLEQIKKMIGGRFGEAAINKAAENIQPWIDDALEQQATADAEGAQELIMGQIAAGVTDLNELIAAAKTKYDDKAIEAALANIGVTKDANGNWVVDEKGYLGLRQAGTAAADEDAALTWLQNYYQPGWDEAKLREMLKSNKFSDEAINGALERFGVFKTEIDLRAEDEEFGDAFNQMYEFMSGGDLDIESLKEKLDRLEYSDAAIERAAEAIAPFLEEAQEKQAEADASEFEGAVSSAYNNIIELYSDKTATTEADLRALLKNANYSDEVINEAISRFNSIKHIIDDKAFKTDTKNAASLIMDAYIKGETDLATLQAMAEQQYGKDAALEAMNQLGYFFIAGYNKTVETNTKLAFNLMLETMQNYNVTDLATLQSLAAGLYGSDAAAAALEQIKPFAELNAEQLANANVNLGMKMMQDMMASGETDIEKLKDIVAAWYGDDVAEVVAERFAPLAELGAAEQKEATIQSALAWMIDAYNDGVTDRVTLEKQAAAIFGDKAIAKEASKLFAPFREWGDKISTEAKVQSALEWMIGSGETDLDKLEKQVAAIFGDETIAAEAMKRYEPIASGDAEQMIYDAATMFAYDDDGNFTYTGSESDKNFIKRMLNTTAYSMYKPYAKEIIAQLDADLAAMKGAEAGDVGDAFGSITENESWLSNPATSTMENYSTTLEQYKQKYGVNSQEYKDVLAAGSASIKDYILKATDDVDMLDQAGSWLGIDFADMDDADKINAMLEGAGELHKQGYMTDNDYEEIINEWITGEISLVSGDKSSFFGLSQIVGHIKGYLDEGYMSESMFNKIVGEISKSVSLGKGQFVGNNTSTIETPNGDTIPLNANVFMNVTMSGADKGSSWSVSAMSVYGLYNNESEASELEKKIKRMFGNVGAAVPIHYNGEIYFWSQSGHLYKANMDESFFEKDGKKETKDQAEWSKQLILSVISNNGPKPINTQR
jgi:SOS response regulatory protein OraA/RecX